MTDDELVTKLTRARDILVKLRDESTGTRWSLVEDDEFDDEDRETILVATADDEPFTWVAEFTEASSAADQDLIVTQHATLNAQIDILNAGLQWFDDWEPWNYSDGRPASADRQFKIPPFGRAALALAESVIGAAG